MTARTIFAPVAGLVVMSAVLTMPGGAQPASATPPAQLESSANTTDTPDTMGSAEPSTGPDKIQPMLREELSDSATTDFWIRFDDAADLTAASRIDDWTQRGAAVADALREAASVSQADVRAHLDAESIDYQAFWATNAIHVQDGDTELARVMADYDEVGALLPAREYDPPELERDDAARTLNSVEWGIAAIKADDVWSQYDIRGDGIVVANIDSGVQHDHPALVDRYRGNLGDGTFEHDYNWFDAYGTCADGAPCDTDGHGTHTMGTMAGSDGEQNQIGVAPDVTWIAANGCCRNDAGLIASAQWMLEPTDLTGANPDASKRPHIVNNSWGSGYPSADPFLEDIMVAWDAAGIMGVWSNGNMGPGCRTSGSPGSRIINYSVGAFDVDGTIADFSSRGSGQDGEIKPNIAAPGVSVRSAVPGDGYDVARGTSMAAPHVAGTIALLWSGAPGLVGDIAGTRALLDGTASDAPDDQCGGTTDGGNDDNNVYGEGRLDALALLDAAPVGGTGTLDATIVDAADGAPVEEATITVDGPVRRERVSGDDGRYAMLLPPGDYTVSVTAFGYAGVTTEVTIETGETLEHRFDLDAVPSVEVDGRVVDGSGHDWPLYAKVTVAGMPGDGVYTDPADGRFQVTLPAGEPHTVTVDAMYDGYVTTTDAVTVTTDDPALRLEVPVDTEQCPADVGYAFSYDGVFADFDGGDLPGGWSVVDHADTGNVWRFDDPRDRGNRTGGTGGWAEAGSPAGTNPVVDSSLVSPSVDLSGQDSPVLMFRQMFHQLADTAYVDLSLDGGQSWETLLEQTAAVPATHETIPLPQAAGEADVRVRFRLADARYGSRYWQVDDVLLGNRSCVPTPGGLVVGHVTDRNTGELVDGAMVTSDDGNAAAVSTATPEDPAVDDAFYWMFAAHTRTHGFTAEADFFHPHHQVVRVRPNSVNQRDFRLPAGEIVVKQEEVTADVQVGGSPGAARATRTFTVSNTGNAPARVEFRERGDQNPIPRADSADDADGDPWVDIPEYPIPIVDNTVAVHDGKVYSLGGYTYTLSGDTPRSFVYDPRAGAWSEIAALPDVRKGAAAAFIGDLLYVYGGWGPDGRQRNTTFVYDPDADSWGTAADGPRGIAGAGTAVLDGKLYVVGGCTNNCVHNDVQRYDPATDTWDVLADYPEAVAHGACGGIDGTLYCAGGNRTGVVWARTYAYDPDTDTWTRKADLPIQLWGMAYSVSSDRLLVSGGITGGAPDLGLPDRPRAMTNEGFSYDPRTDTWSPLHPAGDVRYRGGSGCGLFRIGGAARIASTWTVESEMLPTYGDCEPTDVPWMSLDTEAVTVEPGQQVKVRVSYDATDVESGRHEAGVWIWQDTPYLTYPVDVTMNAAP